MRTSNDFWSKGPVPFAVKLLAMPAALGVGKRARTLPTFCPMRPIGIQFGSVAPPAGPQNWVRPAPVAGLPVWGSNIAPLPPRKYSLRSQNPGLELCALVAGLQLCTTFEVGMV